MITEYSDIIIWPVLMISVVLSFCTLVFAILPLLKKEVADIEKKAVESDGMTKILAKNKVLKIILKRVFDIIFSSLAIIALLPALLISMVCLKLTGIGKVFIYRVVVGFKGKQIKRRYLNIYCSPRSDKQEKEMSTIGEILYKSGLNALPVFFQVFTGKFSLVGLSVEEPDKVCDKHKELYNYCKPGFVSLAQVIGDDSSENMMYDLYYLQKDSIILDLVIILSCTATTIINEK